MPRHAKEKTIHSLRCPLNVPQQQNNSLGLPLALWSNNVHLQPSQYRTLFHNRKRTRSISPHATLHAEIYQPTFKTITGSFNDSESWKETMRKGKRNSSANAVNGGKVPNVLSGRFRKGSPRPRWTFAPGLCIPASAIMQFRRNVYEYSTKKLSPSLPYAKWEQQTLVNEKRRCRDD